MRTGWTDKEAAPVLGVAVTRVSQAMLPAIEKIAKLMRVDPKKTMLTIAEAMHSLDVMAEDEIEQRTRELNGTANTHKSNGRH
jgi:hypothetical protein